MFVHDHFSFSRSCPKYTTSQGFASNEQRRDCFATYLFTVPLIAFPPRYPCVPPPEAQGQAVAPGAQVQAVSLSFRLRNSPTSLKGSNSETMTVLTRKTQHFKLQNCQYAKSARNLHPKKFQTTRTLRICTYLSSDGADGASVSFLLSPPPLTPGRRPSDLGTRELPLHVQRVGDILENNKQSQVTNYKVYSFNIIHGLVMIHVSPKLPEV